MTFRLRRQNLLSALTDPHNAGKYHADVLLISSAGTKTIPRKIIPNYHVLTWPVKTGGLGLPVQRQPSGGTLGVLMPGEASRLQLVPCRLSDGFDFQLFLISASVRRKTVPAMKYLTAPMRVESASSGSTVRMFFPFFFPSSSSCCFLFPTLPPRLDPNKLGQTFLCVFYFGCWESTCCFGFG